MAWPGEAARGGLHSSDDFRVSIAAHSFHIFGIYFFSLYMHFFIVAMPNVSIHRVQQAGLIR